MAKFNVYDKAKWHWGAKNAPKDITEEQGATHIAFFLRWCIEQNFISEEFIEECECGNKIQAIKDGTLDCRQFFIDYLDQVLSSDELNTKGQKFANAYYTSDKTKFTKKYSDFYDDYGNWVDTHTDLVAKYGDIAYYYIENSEENYLQIKQIMDNRYEEFLNMK